MRWPRREWAAVRFFLGIDPHVLSRHWTEEAARRALAKHKRRCPRVFRGNYDWVVCRRAVLTNNPQPIDKSLITTR